LLGRSADPEIQAVIDEVICRADHIERVFNTITIQFGPDTMLAAKVKLQPDLNVEEAVRAINSLERELKARVPNLKWCFIEPDVAD
jgi:divalent metal cation (Fe/Co/Zn/Cd) transporter